MECVHLCSRDREVCTEGKRAETSSTYTMKKLSCPRCQQLYTANFNEDGGQVRHPLLLRCGHTFCLVCIKKLLAHEAVKCPTCQMVTPVSNGQLYKTVNPDMFTVGRMWNRRMNLEIQSQKISEKFNPAKVRAKAQKKTPEDQDEGSGISCSECFVNAAVYQCFKCEGLMCKPCFDRIHQRSHTLQKHKPVALTSTASSDSQGSLKLIMPNKGRHRNCSTHDQCQIEYYCDDDQLPICSRCVILGEHKGHNVQTMEDKNKLLLAEMEPAIVEAQQTIWRLEKAEKIVRESMPSAKLNTDLMDTVSMHFMELHALLQAREEQVLDSIRAASDMGTKSFQEMRTHLEQEKRRLEEALMDAARAKHSSLHHLVDADLILQRLKKAEDLPCVVTIKKEVVAAPVKFSGGSSMKDAIQQYGSVCVPDTLQMISLTAAGPDAEKPPVEELRSYSVADLDVDSLSTTDSATASLSGSGVVEENKLDSDSEEEQPATAQVMEAKPVSLPPMKRLVVGNRDEVFVTHICTPASFFVQLGSQKEEIEEMHHKINYHCRSSRRSKIVSEDVKTGSLVLAQYAEDKTWYRARVGRVLQPDMEKKEMRFEVYFIDFGNSVVLPRSKVKKMTQRFTANPIFAHECGLYDILPVDAKTGWTAKAAQTMLEMTENGPMHMVVVNVVGGRLEVDLGTGEQDKVIQDGPVSVRDSLVFLELAVWNARSAGGSVPGSMKPDYLTEARLSEGTVANLGINCTISPSLFYAQVYSEEYHGHLQRLLTSMQRVYRQETKHLYKVFCPRMDMICVARYPKDDNWYRAKVIGLPGHGKVQVQFVDYGNKEVLDHSDICKIMDDFIKYPMQAMEVSLSDVIPVEGFWSKEAKDWFRSTVEFKLCQFRVVNSGVKANSLMGVLYAHNSDTNRLCCVNYELVRRGFAKSTGKWSDGESLKGITLNLQVGNTSSECASSISGGVYRIGSPIFTTATDDLGQDLTEHKDAGEHRATSGGVSQPEEEDDEDLEVGESSQLEEHALEVVVSSYQSPHHFYIQQEEKQSDLHRLMVDMKCYEKEPSCSRVWLVGEFCAVKRVQDHRWYRGCIDSVQDDNTCQVRLVDYGHTDTVQPGNLKPLKSVHGRMECFAECCHLADLMPTGTTDRNQWSQTAKEFVNKAIRLNPTCYVALRGERTADMGLPVDLVVVETAPPTALEPVLYKYVSVSAKLQDRGLAMPMKKETPAPSETDDAPVVVPMFNTKPTPTYIGPESWLEDEEEKKKSQTLSDESSCQTDSSFVIIESKLEVDPHPPPLSTQLRVVPVHVDHLGLIYAQCMAEVKECQAMIDALQAYGQNEAPEDVLEVKKGQTCVAFCSTYSLWLRASVLKVDDEEVEVKYIDYGDTDHVPMANLRPITPELCAKHQLVYEMRLCDVDMTSSDKAWSKEYNKFLNSHVINKGFRAFIKGSTEEQPLLVELIDQKGNNVLQCMRSMDQSMELIYNRSNEIADILKLSNPYTTLKFGNKGDIIHAVVTHLELPNLVSLQRCDDPEEGCYPADLLEVTQLLQELNNLPPQTPGFKELPSAGTMCIGCYRDDDCWYRALVVKANPVNQMVVVFYVDFGNSDALPLDRLRVLPPRFQNLVTQSVRAYLNLTLPESQDCWTMDTYRAMANRIYETKHRVLIKETVPLIVELYDREEGATLSYASLLQKGLVVIPQPDDCPSIEATAEESSSSEEGSTTSITPEQEQELDGKTEQ